jgi:excisionase family DNA binding protein
LNRTSARRHSAVDVDDPARHPLPAVRREQRDDLRNVLRGPIATERNVFGEEVRRSAEGVAERAGRSAGGGAPAAPEGQGAELPRKTRPRPSSAPTLSDLQILWGGRDRLLKVVEVAEHLGICNATVYRLCQSGELPHLRVVNSIRARPKDLAEYVAGGAPPQS